MNDSMVPCEAASKQPSAGTIVSPGKTSIRNRPPLISSTTFASRWAPPWSTSSAGVQVVDIRHWIFGCAMTQGASTMAAAAAAAITPPAFAMNLRRSLIMLTPSLGLRGTMRFFRVGIRDADRNAGGRTPRWEEAERRKPTQARAGFVASLAVTGPLTPRRYLGTSAGTAGWLTSILRRSGTYRSSRASIGGTATHVNRAILDALRAPRTCVCCPLRPRRLAAAAYVRAREGGAVRTVSSLPGRLAQGRAAMIFRYSSSVKAREVSVLTFPFDALASVTRATASSFGNSETAIASYRPVTR